MRDLVRIGTSPDPAHPWRKHPHDGMIICHEHLRQIFLLADPPCEDIPAALVTFWGHKCLMCDATAAPGRLCESADCRRPLHPQWPAVYCCNACALEDA